MIETINRQSKKERPVPDVRLKETLTLTKNLLLSYGREYAQHMPKATIFNQRLIIDDKTYSPSTIEAYLHHLAIRIEDAKKLDPSLEGTLWIEPTMPENPQIGNFYNGIRFSDYVESRGHQCLIWIAKQPWVEPYVFAGRESLFDSVKLVWKLLRNINLLASTTPELAPHQGIKYYPDIAFLVTNALPNRSSNHLHV